MVNVVQCGVRSTSSIYTFYLLVFYDNFVFVRNPWSMARGVDKTLENSVLSAFVDSFEFIETTGSFDIGSWFFLWLYAIYINGANGYFFTGKTNMGFSIDLRLKELRKEIGRMLNYICMRSICLSCIYAFT